VAKEKREQDIKSGKAMRSGREMFEFNPDIFRDEEDVLDTEQLEPEQDQDNEGPIINIDVTGTSIKRTITNNDEPVDNEDLFKEEDIPDDVEDDVEQDDEDNQQNDEEDDVEEEATNENRESDDEKEEEKHQENDEKS